MARAQGASPPAPTLPSRPAPPSAAPTLCLGSVVVDTMTELQMVRARKKSAVEAVLERAGLADLESGRASSHRAASRTLVRRFLSGVTSFS